MLVACTTACRYDTKQDKWQAVRDMCPHRLAPLSEGRVDEHGNIQCPQVSAGSSSITAAKALISSVEQFKRYRSSL
jgi:Rieske [2Fe-2S] domain